MKKLWKRWKKKNLWSSSLLQSNKLKIATTPMMQLILTAANKITNDTFTQKQSVLSTIKTLLSPMCASIIYWVTIGLLQWGLGLYEVASFYEK